MYPALRSASGQQWQIAAPAEADTVEHTELAACDTIAPCNAILPFCRRSEMSLNQQALGALARHRSLSRVTAFTKSSEALIL